MELLLMGRKYKAILMFKSRMAMSFVLEEMNICCNCVRRKNMEFLGLKNKKIFGFKG
jgi:hypothetical protein